MISEKQKQYLKEVERLKNVKIVPGLYKINNTDFILLEVLEVNETENKVLIKTVGASYIRERTLHWCKKRLEKLSVAKKL